MTKIDAAFDPDCGVWFITEPCPLEAPTISDLLALLKKTYPRRKYTVPDYYPLGTVMPPTIWPVTESATKPLIKVTPNLANKAASFRVGSRYVHLQEPVLEAWAKGMTAPEIAKLLDMPERAVTDIIGQARRLCDPRAARRRDLPASALSDSVL